MGNSLLGGKRTAKVMKISGETMKVVTPIKAEKIVEEYPGHVLLDSEAVKHHGTRAKPLEADQELVPKRLYFLVELPKAPTERNPRRVRSGIQMTAKDRLESLMLARRSVSDLSAIKPGVTSGEGGSNNGSTRIKMRLPKAEVERLVRESRDGKEAAARIVDLCIGSSSNHGNGAALGSGHRNSSNHHHHGVGAEDGGDDLGMVVEEQVHWKSGKLGGQKKVSFLPVNESEMQQVAVASY